MTNLEYTRLFLEQAGIPLDTSTLKLYHHKWWYNFRTKSSNGLRLTDTGYWFAVNQSKIKSYQIKLTNVTNETAKLIIRLDQLIDCPYFINLTDIVLFSEKRASELILFNGDINRYVEVKNNSRINKSKSESLDETEE